MTGMKLPGDISVFKMLDSRLNMLGTRQKSVAENIANVNTPGYVPRDVDQTAFQRALERQSAPKSGGVSLAVTDKGHISGKAPAQPQVALRSDPDSEVTMDGNSVVIEEQVLKINQIRTDFDTAISLYQKGLSLIRMAARSPN